MPLSRTSLLVWLWGVALLVAGPALAQEAPKAESAPKVEDEKPTPWPPPNTVEKKIKGLVLHVPKTWKYEDPANALRLGQFSIPPAEGDKEPIELTIFSFGGGGAGGVQANVQRWVGQFEEKGRKVNIVTGEGHENRVYVLVDIKGTYNMPDGPPIQQKTKSVPDARMLAAIIGMRWEEEVTDENGQKKTEPKSAVYFLKMAGSEKTVTANEEAFRLAFGATNRSKENPFEVREE